LPLIGALAGQVVPLGLTPADDAVVVELGDAAVPDAASGEDEAAVELGAVEVCGAADVLGLLVVAVSSAFFPQLESASRAIAPKQTVHWR
jgi:hypothetical protein